MKRLIRAVSDTIEERSKSLNSLGRDLTLKAKAKYHIENTLYNGLFFAPMEREKMLGAFYPDDKLIVLSERLIDENIPLSTIINIFKHELSHALDYELNGLPLTHGKSFNEYASFFSIEKGFDKAKVSLSICESEKRKERVEKLFRLSESPFIEEAMSALDKAIELSGKIDMSKAHPKEKRLYWTPLFESERVSYSIQGLSEVVSESTSSFVIKCRESVNNRKITSIRAYGALEEVELSLYLFDFLKSALEREVRRLKRSGDSVNLNSFVMGAVSKIEERLKDHDKAELSPILQRKNENMELSRELVFKNGLVRRSISSKVEIESYKKGQEYGKNTPLPKSIGQKSIEMG